MRVLSPKLTRNQLKDPSGMDPKIRELRRKLLKAIEATRSKSLDSLLLYMNLSAFERDVLLRNFDVLLESLERDLKKNQTDYFGWALLFAWFHYRQNRNIYWGVVSPEEVEGTVSYKKPQIKMEMPPIDKEIQRIYNDRVNNLMGDVRTEMRDGIRMDLDNALLNQWDSKKLNKKLDERFRHAEKRATVIARTEMQFAYNSFIIDQARKDGFDELMWVTQLDEFVCQVCGPRHGKVYNIDNLPEIPAHPNCRCIFRIVMKK